MGYLPPTVSYLFLIYTYHLQYKHGGFSTCSTRNGTPDSPAKALAIKVFPVPGRFITPRVFTARNACKCGPQTLNNPRIAHMELENGPLEKKMLEAIIFSFHVSFRGRYRYKHHLQNLRSFHKMEKTKKRHPGGTAGRHNFPAVGGQGWCHEICVVLYIALAPWKSPHSFVYLWLVAGGVRQW